MRSYLSKKDQRCLECVVVIMRNIRREDLIREIQIYRLGLAIRPLQEG